MKAFLIGLLAWSASAWLATINTLPYLSPAITLLGWGGAFVCVLGMAAASMKLVERHEKEGKMPPFPNLRKVDVEVPA